MTEVDVHVFSAISELLRQAIGLSDASVGRKTLDQAVQHRMQQVHVQDTRTYLLMLQADPRELQHFIDEIVVSESWFFRELSPFECLRLFCRARLDEGCKKLRLLSAPCSRGEEPYSMAMTLLDMGLQPDQFEIIACDVSSGALEAAKRGLYRPLAFRERHETSERLTKRYFRDEGSERMLDASVRGTVIFRRENLAAVDFLGSESPFDVVFCRNLLIYLTEDARRIALNHLARLLTRDGLLYFGHSECRQGRQMGLVSWHPRFPAAFTNSSNATKKPFHESGAAERRQIDNPMSKLKIPDLPASLTTPIAQPSPTLGETPPAIRTTQPSLPHATEIGEEIAKARDLANRGLLQEAESCCQRLQTLHRFNPDVLCLLGVIKQASGQLSVAKQLFQQALFLAPDHREALTHLMLFSRIDGNDTQAANYQRRLERTPERDSLKP